MPNETDNTLIISLPTRNRDAFLEAIKGPVDWCYPVDARHDFEQPRLPEDNHSRLAMESILVAPETLVKSFHDFMEPHGWPRTMKPSRKDLILFHMDRESFAPKQVAFSMPRLSPWKDQAEHDYFFPPADPDAAFWTAPKGFHRRNMIIELRRRKIGPKWVPGNVEIEVDKACNDRSLITITYTTPWSPLEDTAGLLKDILAAHGAKMLLTWVEEQGLCGYQAFDPEDPENFQEEEFDFDNQWMEEITDEDDGETYTQFNRLAFENAIFESVGDDDFAVALESITS